MFQNFENSDQTNSKLNQNDTCDVLKDLRTEDRRMMRDTLRKDAKPAERRWLIPDATDLSSRRSSRNLRSMVIYLEGLSPMKYPGRPQSDNRSVF